MSAQEQSDRGGHRSATPDEPTAGRSRWGRPYRRLRRWARHTPNGTIALNMLTVGAALVLLAVILALTVL